MHKGCRENMQGYLALKRTSLCSLASCVLLAQVRRLTLYYLDVIDPGALSQLQP